jgi:hypothetical protein
MDEMLRSALGFDESTYQAAGQLLWQLMERPELGWHSREADAQLQLIAARGWPDAADEAEQRRAALDAAIARLFDCNLLEMDEHQRVVFVVRPGFTQGPSAQDAQRRLTELSHIPAGTITYTDGVSIKRRSTQVSVAACSEWTLSQSAEGIVEWQVPTISWRGRGGSMVSALATGKLAHMMRSQIAQAQSADPSSVTVAAGSVWTLFMSCLRVWLEGREEAVDAGELEVLLTSLGTRHLIAALREVNEQIELCQRLDAAPDPRHVDFAQQLGARSSLDFPVQDQEAVVDRELWQRLVIASTSYALGRATYIVGLQADLVRASWRKGEIDEATAQWILDQIASRRSEDGTGGQLGMEMDEREWTSLAYLLDASRTAA